MFAALLKKFPNLSQLGLILPLYALSFVIMGIAVAPALAFFSARFEWVSPESEILRWIVSGIAAVLAYFVYGFVLIFLVPAVNLLILPFVKAGRGVYHAPGTIVWYAHNNLTYIVRFTFLQFITPSPFNLLFYKMMGMKIGRGVQINSTNISDPGLITLEDYVTIGGSATLAAHYGVAGFLIRSPIVIRKGATVGLKATLLGGVEIGEGSTIMPNSFIAPKMKIPGGELWGGIPAVCIRSKKENKT